MPRLTPTVKLLLIGLFSAYVLQLLAGNVGVDLFNLLALAPGAKLPWQLVTYVLVDRNHPLMFLLGLLFIAWAMSMFELTFGPKRTWQLCAVATLSASLPVLLLGYVMPAPTLYGSNPLWFGAVATVTWLDRSRPLSFFGLVPMTGQQFLYVLLGLSVLMFLFSTNATQLVADLGALGGGIAYANWLRRPRKPRGPRQAPRGPKRPNPKGLRVIPGGQDDDRLLH